MSLSPEDKEAYRTDGLDPKRRNDFRAARNSAVPIPFEDYLRWLTDLQSLFPTTYTSPRLPRTDQNRL